MNRMEELDMHHEASAAVTRYIRENPPGEVDMVTFSNAVNARVAGFCMAVRYVETYEDRDMRTWSARLKFWRPRPGLVGIAEAAVNDFMMRAYPTLSDRALTAALRVAVTAGFFEGWNFRWDRHRASA